MLTSNGSYQETGNTYLRQRLSFHNALSEPLVSYKSCYLGLQAAVASSPTRSYLSISLCCLVIWQLRQFPQINVFLMCSSSKSASFWWIYIPCNMKVPN